MILFSIIASIPVYFLRLKIVSLCEGCNWIIANGVPVLVTGFIYAVFGMMLLLISKDSVASVLLKKIKGKSKSV